VFLTSALAVTLNAVPGTIRCWRSVQISNGNAVTGTKAAIGWWCGLCRKCRAVSLDSVCGDCMKPMAMFDPRRDTEAGAQLRWEKMAAGIASDTLDSPKRTRKFSRGAMSAAHAIVAWTPTNAIGTETRGQVLVGQWKPKTAPHWALPYTNLAGATLAARRRMTEAEALRALHRDYAVLVGDGIEPEVIEAAFSAIPRWLTRKSQVVG
jgi:hypothetical protein